MHSYLWYDKPDALRIESRSSSGIGEKILRPVTSCRSASMPSAYVSIRQHTSAYASIRQHTSASSEYASAYISISTDPLYWLARQPRLISSTTHYPQQYTPADVSIRQQTSAYVSIRQHTPAYASIRQHTPAYVRLRLDCSGAPARGQMSYISSAPLCFGICLHSLD